MDELGADQRLGLNNLLARKFSDDHNAGVESVSVDFILCGAELFMLVHRVNFEGLASLDGSQCSVFGSLDDGNRLERQHHFVGESEFFSEWLLFLELV